MNIDAAVMNVPWHEARTQFEHYRALVKERPRHATTDDVTLYRALWQIQRGQKVIDIAKAIVVGGLNEQGLPKLAIGRAHWPHVHCWRHQGRAVFARAAQPWSWDGKERAARQGVAVQMPGLGDVRGRAQTPMIPAQHRPHGALTGYHLLWEAAWEAVPVDPILLRHIDGPFYVALAQWDLTPLEQAVLRAKL